MPLAQSFSPLPKPLFKVIILPFMNSQCGIQAPFMNVQGLFMNVQAILRGPPLINGSTAKTKTKPKKERIVMTMRHDSTLSVLNEEQQAQLYDWLQNLGYTETLQKVAALPPEGFGIKTHRASLHAFFKRYAREIRTEDVAVAKENRPDPRRLAHSRFRRRAILPARCPPTRHLADDR
jgi:hypothetical protein